MIPRPSFSRLPVIVWVFPLAVYEVHGLKGSTNGSSLLRFLASWEHWRMWHGGAIRSFSKFHRKAFQVSGIKFWARHLYHILDGYFRLPGRRRKWFRCNHPGLFNERDYYRVKRANVDGSNIFLINSISSLPFYYRSCHIFEHLVLRGGFLEYSVKTESFERFNTSVRLRWYRLCDISHEKFHDSGRLSR